MFIGRFKKKILNVQTGPDWADKKSIFKFDMIDSQVVLNFMFF